MLYKLRHNRHFFYVGLLFLITLSIFLYTLQIRKPWFGTLAHGNHQYLTGSTVKFARFWYHENPFNIHFAMLEEPKSIEFANIQERDPYVSYPIGTITPIYLISVLTQTEPSPAMAMGYNLANHFLISLFLGLTVYLLLIKLKFNPLPAFLFSMIPVFLELLLPPPLYWHQNAYFADQAVILPFVLYVFLETLKNKNNKKIQILQGLVSVWGVSTDWLFIFLLAVAFIRDILPIRQFKNLSHAIRRSFIFWLPTLITLTFYLYQLVKLDAFGELWFRFLVRVGVVSESRTETVRDLFDPYWLYFLQDAYGGLGLWLTLFSIFFYIFSLYIYFYKAKRYLTQLKQNALLKIISLMTLLIVPPALQVFVLFEHSMIHNFSTLKFSILLATVPFVLIPVFIYELFKQKGLIKQQYLLTAVMLLLSGAYLVVTHPTYQKFFPPPEPSIEQIGTAINRCTDFNDIVFSPDYNIPKNPPQRLSYSLKRVYSFTNSDEIKKKASQVKGDYQVVLFFTKPPEAKFQPLIENANLRNCQPYYFYELKKE